MITIYHLGVSQSDRIVWLMEELELPYQLEWYDRGADMLAPPEYRALHPAATAPVIRDGHVLLCESAAIVEYIIQRHGHGRLGVRPEQSNYPDYLYWMNINTSLQSTFSVQMALAALTEADRQKSIMARSSSRRQQAYLTYLDDRLGEYDYVAGPEFTAADIMVVFNVTTLPAFGGINIDGRQNISHYVQRIDQRPAYRKAMRIAGPDAKRPA